MVASQEVTALRRKIETLEVRLDDTTRALGVLTRMVTDLRGQTLPHRGPYATSTHPAVRTARDITTQ
jgi:hypothetical protein